MATSEAGSTFVHGVNYGNVFIPEDFFADNIFFKKNNIPKVTDQYSLCDLTGSSSHVKSAMTDWLKS